MRLKMRDVDPRGIMAPSFRAWWCQHGRIYFVAVRRARTDQWLPVVHWPDHTRAGEPRLRWRAGRWKGSFVWVNR